MARKAIATGAPAITHNPLLWLLAFVPAVFIVVKLHVGSHTLTFLLSVCAIVPLVALLGRATNQLRARLATWSGAC